MRQILCSDWLPERARWANIARSGLPAQDCPFYSYNKISPKSKRVHKNFLLQNNFCDSKKIFCDSSVGMELENKKAESVNDNENKENKTSLLHITGFLFSA